MSSDFLLLTREDATERAVASALSIADGARESWCCRDFTELDDRLTSAGALVVLVDADPDPLGVLRQLDPLVKRHASARFVLLCTSLENEVLFEAMQVGARHCLLKSALAQDLPGTLERLSAGAGSKDLQGRLISVFSTRGGCGATTVAINLAEELRAARDRSVLLVDLDLDYGAACSFLGIEPRYGVRDVLAGGERIDAELIRSTACDFREDFQVLASPASIDAGGHSELDPAHVGHLVDACRKAYSYTVVDAPRLDVETSAKLARASAVVLVVFELAVVDVRAARRLIGELEDRGVDREAIVPLANRYQRRGPMLSIKDAQEALLGRDIRTVRNDFSAAIRSANLGEPLAAIAPRSPARKDLLELLESLADRLPQAA